MGAAREVRKIDSVGRVAIPKEVMKSLGIYNGDSIEFLLFEGYVIFSKHKPYINAPQNIEITEEEISKNNACNLDKIDETIRLLNNAKKLYKTYLGMD